MPRIRFLCNIAIFAIIPVSMFYVYDAGGWALNEALLQPQRWLNDHWVHPGADIALATRWVFLILWLIPVVIGFIGFMIALRLLLLVRSGLLFDARVARMVAGVGYAVAGSGLSDVIAACLSPMIKSWHNPGGPLPLRFWFGSEEFGLIFCGLGFVLMGAILREAIKLARENEAFV